MSLKEEFEVLDGNKLADMFEARLGRFEIDGQLDEVSAQVKSVEAFKILAARAKQDVLAYSFGNEENAAAIFTGVVATLAALSDYAENEALGSNFATG